MGSLGYGFAGKYIRRTFLALESLPQYKTNRHFVIPVYTYFLKVLNNEIHEASATLTSYEHLSPIGVYCRAAPNFGSGHVLQKGGGCVGVLAREALNGSREAPECSERSEEGGNEGNDGGGAGDPIALRTAFPF